MIRLMILRGHPFECPSLNDSSQARKLNDKFRLSGPPKVKSGPGQGASRYQIPGC